MNSELSPVIAVAFLAAALAAFTKTVIRRMSSTESASKIVFYFSALATIASGIPLLWLWEPIPSHHWFGVLAMGLLAVYGQLAMTKAFSIAPPAKVGVFTYSSVIFAALLGFCLMKHLPGTCYGVLSSYLWRVILQYVRVVKASKFVFGNLPQ